MEIKIEKIKTKLNDYYHLIFKSTADNHFRIQHCHQNPEGEVKCDIFFNSYTALKNYQKKIRRVAFSTTGVIAVIIVSTLVIQVMLPVFKSKAATYDWVQGGDTNGWLTENSTATVSHQGSTAGTTEAYRSKSANLTTGSALELSPANPDPWDGDLATVPVDEADDVNVTRNNGVIYVTRPTDAVCANDYECSSGSCTSGTCE